MIDPGAKIDLTPYFNTIVEEFQSTYQTVKDRGLRFFIRPLLIAGAAVGLAYKFVYQPPALKLATLNKKFEAAQMTLMFADRYIAVRDKLLAFYPELPGIDGRDEWLLNSVIRTMKVRGITSHSIKPATETDEPGLIYQTVRVNASLTFVDLMRWLKMVEEEKPLLHIETLRITKKNDRIGIVDVDCEISSIIIQRRFAP